MDRDKYEDPDNIVKAEPRVSNMDDNELNAFKLWKEQKEKRVAGSRSFSNGKTINHLHKINLSFILIITNI